MSRKPIDQQQPSACRGAMWALIRKLKTFSSYEIQYETCLTPQSVDEYLVGLTNAGNLKRLVKAPDGTPWECIAHKYYTLVNDAGVDAPRIRKDGTPVTQGQGRLQMWNAMQVLKTFCSADLAFNASTPECRVSESEAKNYIGALHRANYLKLQSPSKPGHKKGTGKQANYTLIPTMWTGPHPPQIQRTKQVYDPNLRRVVWARVEGGAE